MGIRINGISTPFGGISWERTEERKRQCQLIEYLLVILESKRLITLPFSRNHHIPFEKDKSWCALSAIDIKYRILEILKIGGFPPETVSVLRNMCGYCNRLSDKLNEDGTLKIIQQEVLSEGEEFIRQIRRFKNEIASAVSKLQQIYPDLFKEEGFAGLFKRMNQ